MAGSTVFWLLAILVLLLFSAFFSAAETAFSSLNKNRIKTYAEQGIPSAALALHLTERYDELLSAILIGNNLVNIAIASLGTMLFVSYFGDAGASLAIIAVTLAVLVFGEITPKGIAKERPETFAMFSAPFLVVLIWLCKPLCFLFTLLKKLLTKSFRLENTAKTSQEELLMFVDEVSQEGSINKNQSELLHNAIEFSSRTAKDILTPRVKLGAVPVEATKEEIGRHFSETKFSRLLVYQGSIDNIIGVLHLKNFYENCGVTKRDLREILSPVVFVSSAEKLGSIQRKLQQNQSQVAVVLDEFGGTYGIITMEDVLEELVGEIWDELDNVSEPFRRLSDGVVRVEASVELEDFCRFFHIEIPSEMVSVSGWVMEQMHGLPRQGDTFTYQNLRIIVISVKRRCVSLIEVHVTAAPRQDPVENP